MAGRPWAMAELMRQALCWHGTSRRHLQETDEPNQVFLLFWNGGSIMLWPTDAGAAAINVSGLLKAIAKQGLITKGLITATTSDFNN